ncbi:MAG TPA: universal stress protein [Polaromonas sp.]|uniref:universal stress protein n=1 Tax=Polaromonas sp. TaxID=1869339 RepID=UPI002D4AF7BE|nr:universal stress protein [Polaromonas sp.]HYW58313.1 universal stress protein [Polaromonas sp.]
MYKRIMVAVDGSDASNKALVAATDLARDCGGRSVLLLVHALDDMAYISGLDPYGGQSGALIEIMRETGEKILAEALAIAESAGVQAETLLIDRLDERLGDTVAREAQQWKADLIVVGTHGRRNISRMLLGSGAEQIIRLSPVPVLVVRKAEDAAAK